MEFKISQPDPNTCSLAVNTGGLKNTFCIELSTLLSVYPNRHQA